MKFNNIEPMLQNKTVSIDLKVERKTFIFYFLLQVGIFIGVCLSPISSLVVASCCICTVFFGPQRTIQAITLLVLIRFMNPAIAVLTPNLSIFSLGMLLLSSILYIPWGIKHAANQLFPVIIFSVCALLLSGITSSSVWISYLKIISFLLSALTVISALNKLNVKQIRNVIAWMFSIMFVVVFLSLCTLVNRNIAYHLNGVAFQGIFSHPQAMGVFLAPLASFFVGRFMFCKKDFLSVDMLIIPILIYMIIVTQARTAAVSVFLSFMTTLFIVNMPVIRQKIKVKGSFFIKLILAIFVVAIVIGIYPSLLDVAHDFIFKRESSGIDEAMSSRSRGLSLQWENFLASPIIGNGFGVYAGPVPANNVQYLMGIPISAAVEKGFMPTALLEEVGILGTIPFLFMMYSIIKLVLKNTAPSWICMFFASIFINIGEYVFFSTAAMGMFYWIIMILCTVTHKNEATAK